MKRLEHVGACLAVWAVLLEAPTARAQVPGEEIARRAFEDGIALEKKADYAAALAKFAESAKIKVTLGNRFHKAFCLEMTGKLAVALNEYEAVDTSAREQSKTDVIAATRVRLEQLRPRVPELAVRLGTSPPNDVEVMLDGSAISGALLDGRMFRVDPGEHTVTARALHHEPFTKTLTLAEGATATVDIAFERSGPAWKPGASSAARITEPPVEGPRPRSYTGAIVTTAGAVVLAAGGVVAFVVAGDAKTKAEKACPTRLSCDAEQSKVRTLDVVALAGFVGAATLSVVAIVLWTSKPSTSSSSSVVARGSWLGVEGRF